jgi:hypothetical protein
MKFLSLTIAALSLLTITAEAARRDNRQASQRSRIQQGVKSGELTKKEASGLRAEQRKIRRMERRAEADGNVTGREKARIERRQDKANKHIYNQKHDDQKRESQGEAAQE